MVAASSQESNWAMTDSWAIVIAASIPVFATGLGWIVKLLLNLSKDNKYDHNIVMEEIKTLTKAVKKSGKKIDKHIDHQEYYEE